MNKRITIALMLGFFGCQGQEGCANGTSGGSTVGKSCFTRCLHACEAIYSEDSENSLEWCTNDCNRENCLGQDAGRISLDTGVIAPYDGGDPLDASTPDQGFLDAGYINPCVTDCLGGLVYPQCAGEFECCNLYCNS